MYFTSAVIRILEIINHFRERQSAGLGGGGEALYFETLTFFGVKKLFSPMLGVSKEISVFLAGVCPRGWGEL